MQGAVADTVSQVATKSLKDDELLTSATMHTKQLITDLLNDGDVQMQAEKFVKRSLILLIIIIYKGTVVLPTRDPQVFFVDFIYMIIKQVSVLFVSSEVFVPLLHSFVIFRKTFVDFFNKN